MSITTDPEELGTVFEYLDELRESGETNMFGAAPYVVEAFGLTRETATKMVALWMQTFDGESTVEARAEKAGASA